MASQQYTVSLIVPTYHERDNLPYLIERVEKVMREHKLLLELLIMDDNSNDGTKEYINSLNKPWIRLIVRSAKRDLSAAAVDGLKLAKNDIIIVMDADLSHPPEKIPELIKQIANGHDFVIGSRYVKGGSTDRDWNLLRRINSKGAVLMARPFTSAQDPMSGFFALPRKSLEKAGPLNPLGYKIGLELIVKCRCKNISEIPIHFTDRKFGQSKMSLKEQLYYIQHLLRLYTFKFTKK